MYYIAISFSGFFRTQIVDCGALLIILSTRSIAMSEKKPFLQNTEERLQRSIELRYSNCVVDIGFDRDHLELVKPGGTL